MERPVIFNYHDYRSFLSDYFEYAKAQDRKFSYRYFAQRAGFSSGSFLKLVIDGKRNLTIESINKISRGFKLRKKEHDYLEKLVFMNQASSHETRNFYYKQMLSMKGYSKVNQIAKANYDYFSKWYYPVIREIVTFGDKNHTPAKIASLLKPEITENQARYALDQLVKLGLIRKNKDDLWEQCDKHITTGPEVRSFIVSQYHREMLKLAFESIERFPSDQRDISAVTFSAQSSKLQELKKLIAEFRERVRSNIVEDGNGNADIALQLNIQLYPLTKRDDKGERDDEPQN